MNNLLSTSQLANLLGVSISTIYRWLKAKKIEEPARTYGNHRRFDKTNFQEKNTNTILYSRVSSYGQKEDLKRQANALKQYAKSNNIKNIVEISEIGSGLNFRKKGFLKLLKMIVKNEVKEVIIQEKDRLSRFGINIIKAFSNEFNTKITIMFDDKEKPYEIRLMADLMALLTSFTGTIHGKRSHKNMKIAI